MVGPDSLKTGENSPRRRGAFAEIIGSLSGELRRPVSGWLGAGAAGLPRRSGAATSAANFPTTAIKGSAGDGPPAHTLHLRASQNQFRQTQSAADKTNTC